MGLKGVFGQGTRQISIVQAALMLLVSAAKRAAGFTYVKIGTVLTSELVNQASVIARVVFREMVRNLTVLVFVVPICMSP